MRPRQGTRATRQAPLTLTPRQEEVMRLLRKGRTNGEIAEALGITLDGAKFHVAEIISKLGASSREDAVRIWESRSRFRIPLVSALAWAKWAGAAAGVVAIAGGLVVWAVLLRDGSGGDGDTPSSEAEQGVAVLPTPGCAPAPAARAGDSQPIPFDFVQFNGIAYLGPKGGFGSPPQQIPPSQIGTRFATVAYTQADGLNGDGYGGVDCGAGMLSPGTELFRVTGFDPRFRLSLADGSLYEAHRNESAQTVGEFTDLDRKVVSIDVEAAGPVVDGTADFAVVGRINDPATVDSVVSDLLQSKVDAGGGTGKSYRLTFKLVDGTVFVRTFWPDIPVLYPGVRVSDSFTQTILAAIE